MKTRRVLYRHGASDGACLTCEVDLAEGREERDYVLVSKTAVRKQGLPGRVGVDTDSDNFYLAIFDDLVLRNVGEGNVEVIFRRRADGSMAPDEAEALREAIVRGGWAKRPADVESVFTELMGEATAMDVRLDG